MNAFTEDEKVLKVKMLFLYHQRREARKQEQANNPFYIKASPSSQKVCLLLFWNLF